MYRAWDPRLEREVALKILHARFETDPERVKNFVAEARAASGLNHPNIVTVFDAAVDGGTPYIVSELIDGRPLRDEVQRGPLQIKRLLDLAAQMADGLSAAHDAGIVHCDLKPENIMVTRTGRVKIVDFGLVRAGGFQTARTAAPLDQTKTMTEAGLLVGTVPYMSPEQARGERTDFRSDQFSFGLILYEMATGRRAFRRDTSAATLDAIINDELPPMKTLDTRGPVLLKWIIERCLAKDRADRYSATADLHRDLKMLRDKLSEAVGAETNASTPPTGRTWRRVAIAAAVLLLAGTGAVLFNPFRPPEPPDTSALRFSPLVAEPRYEGLPAWSPTGQTIAYVAEVDGTLQLFTRKLASSESAQLTFGNFDCRHPFWSPDGQRIYYVSLARDKEGIWSVGAAGGAPQIAVENATRGAISPDHRTMAFLRDEERADIVGTAALWLSTPGGTGPWTSTAVEAAARKHESFGGMPFIEGALAFSPDGNKLGVSVVPGPREKSVWQFWIVPLPNGAAVQHLAEWTEPGPRISNFSWLPDSRHVVLGIASLSTSGSQLWLADLEHDRTWQLTRSPDSQSYPSVSPDGRQIVFTSGEPEYDLLEMPLDGLVPRTLRSTSRNESDAEYARDGRRLTYVTDRNGQDEIWVRMRDGQLEDQSLITQEDFGGDRTLMLASPTFSPDGQRIAYQRNGYHPRWPLRIWISPSAGGPQMPLQSRSYEAIQGAPAWSPESQWIAYAEWKDAHWSLVKTRVGSTDAPLTLRSDGVGNATPRWSPNNDWITWETAKGFVLVSPDGTQEKVLEDSRDYNPWLVHTWSRDGSEIIGVKETDARKLAIFSLNIKTGKKTTLAHLGGAPPVNNPIKGFNLSPDGRTIVMGLVRLHGDLWIVDGLRLPQR